MTRLLSSAYLLLCIVSLSLCFDINSTDSEVKIRSKRNYYGGYDYGYGDDYWYAGRIFGIIIGSLLFLLCCCAPCICLAGIWFLGWFGFRDRRTRRQQAKAAPVHDIPPPPMAYTTSSRPREVIIDTAPPPRARERDQIIYQAEDRFYSSSAPVTDNRYRSSNF